MKSSTLVASAVVLAVILLSCGHASAVVGVEAAAMAAFSPDGKSVVVIDHRGDAILRDIGTGREVGRFTIEAKSRLNSRAMWFSADGGTLAVWQRAAKSRDESPMEHEAVQVWEVATMRPLRAFMGAQFRGISADGKTVAVLEAGKRIVIYDVESGRARGTLEGIVGNEEYLTGVRVVFSADGKALATAEPDGAVRIWEAATGRVRSVVLEGKPRDEVKMSVYPLEPHLAFSPDGGILAVGRHDRQLMLWDVRAGKEMGRLEGRADATPVFSPDGKVLLAVRAADKSEAAGEMVLWNLATKQRRVSVALPSWRAHDVAAFSADGRMLATAMGAAENSPVTMWEVASGREIKRIEAPRRRVDVLRFTADGKGLLAASALGDPNGPSAEVRRWDANGEWRVAAVMEAKSATVTWGGRASALYVSRGGRLAAVVFTDWWMGGGGEAIGDGGVVRGNLSTSPNGLEDVQIECETPDGASGTITIAGHRYDLSRGAVFLTRARGGGKELAPEQIVQLSTRLGDVAATEEGVQKLAKEDKEIAKYLAGTGVDPGPGK